MQSLEVISVNIWQIVISLLNLLIMFLILKKFLFKPVQKIVAERKGQVEKIYSDAEADRDKAAASRKEYEARLAAARETADTIVRDATDNARRQSDAIVAEASAESARLKQKAEEEIAREKSRMLADVRTEISELAVGIAGKVVEKELDSETYDSFVEDFIRNVGDNK